MTVTLHCHATRHMSRVTLTRHILLFSNTSTSQSNSQSSVETRSWCSPPPLPVTPDIVPRCIYIYSYRLLHLYPTKIFLLSAFAIVSLKYSLFKTRPSRRHCS